MLMNDVLQKIARTYRENNENIIYLLQETQEALGFIPKEAISFFSEELKIAPSRFYGIVTFYSQFRLTPLGRNKITACCGTACHVRGSEKLINSVRRELDLSETKDTTDDNEFTIETVNCIGACSIAPVFVINKKVYGKATSVKLIKEIRTLSDITDDQS